MSDPKSGISDVRHDDDESLLTTLGRRRFLSGGAVAGSIAVAGCLDGEPTDEDPDSEDADGDESGDGDADIEDGDADGGDEDDEYETLEDELVAVIDAYVEAASEGDTDAVDDVVHSLNPLNPAEWEEDGWEFQGGDDDEVGDYETELLTEDGTIDDIFELEAAEFWFAEVNLEDEIGGEQIAMVEIEEADGTETQDTAVWVFVPEDGEWRVLFQGVRDETPEDPESVFEPEIIDEDDAVVEEIDWEFDQEMGDGDDGEDDLGLFEDLEWAQVTLTDVPGIDADAVRIESTIEDSSFEFTEGWSGAWANVGLHAEGDQIVVTVVENGDETVVHREHFRPDSE
ncbi:hypothetical protein [Halobiforma nitratireducens]|uniref:Uncharacterized protein n=1 Tax=Halobiforma nitratireducens JCM 10879 TaxID=1227454 RepID=M0M851_9EURY|nr:hypothetical protein [Halobiforma nitratireducens]EMA41911.1 hypothetical protein C446_04470 [Halobiforma nitratireducens JCM 10879]